MEVTVTFRHFDPNEALKNYAREKVTRIEKYYSNITEVHVILSLEKRSHIAEVILSVNRAKITAKDSSEDNMYSAIDLVMDKIEKQVKKYKSKLTDHKANQVKARHNIFELPEKTTEPTIIKTESVHIRPLTIDEAIMQIELNDDDFLVFRNSDTDKVNVLYRRREGCLGLIEPENS